MDLKNEGLLTLKVVTKSPSSLNTSVNSLSLPFCLLEIQDKVEEGRSKEGYQETGRQEADQEAC